jgi:hypothetical protein
MLIISTTPLALSINNQVKEPVSLFAYVASAALLASVARVIILFLRKMNKSIGNLHSKAAVFPNF